MHAVRLGQICDINKEQLVWPLCDWQVQRRPSASLYRLCCWFLHHSYWFVDLLKLRFGDYISVNFRLFYLRVVWRRLLQWHSCLSLRRLLVRQKQLGWKYRVHVLLSGDLQLGECGKLRQVQRGEVRLRVGCDGLR